MTPIGIYLHVPFCDGKCPYCDFFSLNSEESDMDAYTEYMVKTIEQDGQKIKRPADTLYIGGGTPNLLGPERLKMLIQTVKTYFGLLGAEITVEVNPEKDQEFLFQVLKSVGVNRISIGLQSAKKEELEKLGRKHTADQAAKAVLQARRAGIENISLDLMLAIPGQTQQTMRESVKFCAELAVQHISAYLLKIEKGTAFFRDKKNLGLMSEDESAELYLRACEELEKYGYKQYEISNFARPGFQGQHNLKYWHCEEYLGIGPSAHSFLNGKRFYYPRSLRKFLTGEIPVSDGIGGEPQEYAMLALRLTQGLQEEAYAHRFGGKIPEVWKNRAKKYEKAGLTRFTKDGFHFTRQGFLVSNALIAEILQD